MGWGYDCMPSETYGFDNWVKDSAHYYYEKITDDGNCFCHIGSTTKPGRPDSMGETWILSTRRPEAAYATIHYSAGNDGSGGALGSRYNLPGARSTLYWEGHSPAPAPTLRVVS